MRTSTLSTIFHPLRGSLWPPVKLLGLFQLCPVITTTFYPHSGPKWSPITISGQCKLFPTIKTTFYPQLYLSSAPQTFVSTYPPLLHSNIPHLSFVPFSKLRLLRRRCEAFFLEVAPVFPPVLMMSLRGLLFLTGGDSYEKHISSQRGLSESHLHNK